MSEKKIRIETTQDDGSSTVGRTPPAEKRRKGLPAAGEGWKASEHDMVVMGRLSRAIEGVPPAAMRRIAPWFSSLLAEAMKEPPHPELAEQRHPWDATTRAYRPCDPQQAADMAKAG